ncbi:MAG: hypothetical protein FJX02_16170 [Alphaproteobacteria bacterium]|nr:hypothetical protein [Alphaproteobacteria bacterium]
MSPLSDGETRDLGALAAIMIPASATYGMPGADDPTILADILKSLDRDTDDARQALAALATRAGGGAGTFASLPADRRRDIAMAFKDKGGAALFNLNRVVLLCYYRDDRVMRALGQEPRPPFPKGHEVEQGDWSLLDPVRAMKPIWRRAG